jgi:hypothetical protein
MAQAKTPSPAEILAAAEQAEKRFDKAQRELRAFRSTLLKLAGTPTLTEAQKIAARRIARKGLTRRSSTKKN